MLPSVDGKELVHGQRRIRKKQWVAPALAYLYETRDNSLLCLESSHAMSFRVQFPRTNRSCPSSGTSIYLLLVISYLSLTIFSVLPYKAPLETIEQLSVLLGYFPRYEPLSLDSLYKICAVHTYLLLHTYNLLNYLISRYKLAILEEIETLLS